MDCGCEGAKKGTQPWIRSVPELWHGGPNGQIAELPNEDLGARGRGCEAGRLFASGSSRAAGWGGFVIGSVAAAGKGAAGLVGWWRVWRVVSRLVGRVRCGRLFLRPAGPRGIGRCVSLVARCPGRKRLTGGHIRRHPPEPRGRKAKSSCGHHAKFGGGCNALSSCGAERESAFKLLLAGKWCGAAARASEIAGAR